MNSFELQSEKESPRTDGEKLEVQEGVKDTTWYQKHENGMGNVAVLGSHGYTRQEGSRIIWAMNGTEKDSTEVELIFPLITEMITRIYKEGNRDKIDFLRVSPAVAMHLVFEGVLTEDHFHNVVTDDNLATFSGISVETPEGNKMINLVAERDVRQKREGYDLAIMDADNRVL